MGWNNLEKKQDIYGFKRIVAELKEIEHNFREKVKGLNYLYEISQLVEKPGVLFKEIIHETLELIPPAWKFPEMTCARITYDKNCTKQKILKKPNGN